MATTDKGITCQRWDSQSPHPHSRLSMMGGDTAHNYCRNPDHEPQGPWCYTTDPKVRWAYCPVLPCGKYFCFVFLDWGLTSL